MFHSYTLEEGHHTAKTWAFIALGFVCLTFAVLMKAGVRDAYMYSPYYDPAGIAFSAGMIAGLFGAGAIASYMFAMRELIQVARLRRAYKLANPTMFNSAGEEISTGSA